ncbi:MAG: DNA recombination protein RmuC [Bacteroidales bacterium]|jgi:DNA recombination protein RmuC|nr:DNA recombination protein RmuC [Bacteroidales bacterium]
MLENSILFLSGLAAGILLMIIIQVLRRKTARASEGMHIDDLKNTIAASKNELGEKEGEIRRLTGMVASRDANIEALGEKLRDQKKELEEIQERMKKEFRLLADEIMEEKSRRFTRENAEKLDNILKPFNENLKDFREKVERTRLESSKDRASLMTKIAELEKLNTRISDEANALTRALKGDSKARGNWGEMILESILEKSGLVRDREFFVQESYIGGEGGRLQPDIIVKYPGNRSIIIDAKVSLVAYEQYVNAENEAAKEQALKAHLQSVRTHLNKLAAKDYQDEYKLDTVDFVMMFMPVEPAYFLALQADNRLWSDSYEKRVLLMSPTNLIAALKMVESIWKQEYQSRNVIEIARQGGALYDDFVLLLERLEKLGKKLNETQKQYDDTVMKLTGRGNLISRVGHLKELGVKARKEMPDSFRDDELAEGSTSE